MSAPTSTPTSTARGVELLELAVTTARAAAELIRSGAAGGVTVEATKSSDVDVVTEFDRSAEQLIRAALSKARPDDAVLGEEGDDLPGTTGVRWIVDPIDGTTNFLYGLPQYAVSIAAEVDGEVVAGVVLNVATSQEWTAHVGADGALVARRDGAPITVRPGAPLAQLLVATGFSYLPEQRAQQAACLLRLLPQIRDIRRLGSCALDLCAVGDGRLDAYLEEGVNLWDYAAGALVARAAGATMEVLDGAGGRPLVLVAPASSYVELRAAITAAGYLAEPSVTAPADGE